MVVERPMEHISPYCIFLVSCRIALASGCMRDVVEHSRGVTLRRVPLRFQDHLSMKCICLDITDYCEKD
jgi:hypothetical protein